MTVTYDFTGSVALVTGAGSGMGLATAQAFGRAGARVAILDRNQAAVDAAVASIEPRGVALGLVVDVTDEDAVAGAVRDTVLEYGRLDFAFNNAGIMPPPALAAEETAENFERVNAVNVRGVWASMKYELIQMQEQGFGAIVNCSSIGGLVGSAERGAYHGTKHAVIGLTKSAALGYAARGIRVNAICPGTIETPMVDSMNAAGELDRDASIQGTPMRRLGRGEEIAQAVLWLCSPGASYVTGVSLPVDGGLAA